MYPPNILRFPIISYVGQEYGGYLEGYIGF